MKLIIILAFVLSLAACDNPNQYRKYTTNNAQYDDDDEYEKKRKRRKTYSGSSFSSKPSYRSSRSSSFRSGRR